MTMEFKEVYKYQMYARNISDKYHKIFYLKYVLFYKSVIYKMSHVVSTTNK